MSTPKIKKKGPRKTEGLTKSHEVYVLDGIFVFWVSQLIFCIFQKSA